MILFAFQLGLAWSSYGKKPKNNWTYAESNNKDEKTLYRDYFSL